MINTHFFPIGFTFNTEHVKYTILEQVSDKHNLYHVEIQDDLHEECYKSFLTYVDIVYIIYSKSDNKSDNTVH